MLLHVRGRSEAHPSVARCAGLLNVTRRVKSLCGETSFPLFLIHFENAEKLKD